MNLYLPVEVKHRELYSKVLLAKYAAEKGFDVILGKKNDLNKIVLRMPAGVYFGLGVPDNYEDFYRSLVESGNIVVVCEEEGLITYTEDMYLDMRISSKTMQYVDVLFSWGIDNQNLISSKKKELAHKIKVTGHPRFDLLKPEFSNVYKNEIAIIREKYPKYVLICTCFPSCNHFIPGINYVQSLIDKKVLKSQKSIDNFHRYQKIKKKTLCSFLEAIPLLAKTCSETDIVVRPHPSENKEIYVKFANEFRNVHIESNFSVHPWIMATEALVHHYCATSVEAYAAGVPRFSLRPEADPLSEKDIPFECSKVCSSPDELVKAINNCLVDSSSKRHCVTPKKDYSDYVLNISDVVSSKLMAEEISSIVKKTLKKTNSNIKNNDRWYNEYIGRILLLLRDVKAMVIQRNNNWFDYTSHKFDKFTVNEIREVLALFSPDEKERVKCKKKGSKFIQISTRG